MDITPPRRARSRRRLSHRLPTMKLAFFALLLGISIGYFYGFGDAKVYKKNVVERTIDKVGGKNRGRYNNDLDQKVDR